MKVAVHNKVLDPIKALEVVITSDLGCDFPGLKLDFLSLKCVPFKEKCFN